MKRKRNGRRTEKISFLILCVAMLFLLLPGTAYADIGPKPSVVIDFKGLEKERYYVTLLSEDRSTGPYSAFDENSEGRGAVPPEEDYEIWSKFVSYEDQDQFYFLQFFRDCTDTSQFVWSYHPPNKFKILLYFPDKDSFLASDEIYERYAFDSYYTARITEPEIKAGTNEIGGMKVEESYDFTWELISLFARIAATVGIEVAAALLFGFWARQQLFIILVTNLATQSVLNILLNIANYQYGGLAFVFNYVWMELLVIVIEAAVYSVWLRRCCGEKAVSKGFITLYAVAANLISFAVGIWIAQAVPGIF